MGSVVLSLCINGSLTYHDIESQYHQLQCAAECMWEGFQLDSGHGGVASDACTAGGIQWDHLECDGQCLWEMCTMATGPPNIAFSTGWFRANSIQRCHGCLHQGWSIILGTSLVSLGIPAIGHSYLLWFGTGLLSGSMAHGSGNHTANAERLWLYHLELRNGPERHDVSEKCTATPGRGLRRSDAGVARWPDVKKKTRQKSWTPQFPSKKDPKNDTGIFHVPCIFTFPIHISSCFVTEDAFFEGCQRLKGVARSLDLAKLMHQSQASLGCNRPLTEHRAPRCSTWIKEREVLFIHSSGQTITTSAEVTLNGGLVRESHQNPLNSGLGIILICADYYIM